MDVGIQSRSQIREIATVQNVTHILALDGLRGVAVLMVIIHHHFLFVQGWMGVDIFFALSGYLITSGLRVARSEPRFWKRFYTKRCARILPACLVALIVVKIFYRPARASYALYVFLLGDYADASRFVVPAIAVMWSLAVEEHFYLLHPFAIRYLDRRKCAALLAFILCCEPVIRAIFSSQHNAAYIYFLTPFRLDGLCAGALLALALESEVGRSYVQRWAIYYGLAVVAIFGSLVLAFPNTFQRNVGSRLFDSIGYSLVALASMALIAYLLTHPDSLVSRALRLRVLVFLGTISYGMYLFHIFVRDGVEAATGWQPQQCLAVTLVLTILVSWLSYRFYEKPLIVSGRNWLAKDRPERSA